MSVNVFKKQLKTTGKKCTTDNMSTSNCSCSNHYNGTDGQHSLRHRRKRLKTRKQRTEARGEERVPKSKSLHHHHHRQQSSKDKSKTCFHYSCHSSSRCLPMKDAQFAKKFPAVQEPSVITDSRLIGHHGLFNHEVKSIDIERLLSQQRKLEKPGKTREKNMTASHPPPTSYLPSPGSSSDMVVADTSESTLPEKQDDLVTKTPEVCPGKAEATFQSNCQGSDITPGQRPQHQLDLTSESDYDTLSTTNAASGILANKGKKAMTENHTQSELTPCVSTKDVRQRNKVKALLNSHNLEPTLKNQQPPHLQMQICGPSPNPLLLSSSPIVTTSDSFNTVHQEGDGLDCISISVSAVAERLCLCLESPLQRKRNLAAESREVLLQALRERHGPLLEENLLKVQQHIRFGTSPTRAVQDQEKGLSTMDTDGLWPTDAFSAEFQAGNTDQSYFATQKTAPLKRRRKQRHCNWMSPSKPHQRLYQTAEWMSSPSLEKVGDHLEEMLRPDSPSQFHMDFQPSGTSTPDQLFPSCPAPHGRVQASPPQHWDDRFNLVTRRESARLDYFESSFLSQTMTKRNAGPRYSESAYRPLPHYPAWLPDGRQSEPRRFPPDQDAFDETNRLSFGPSSSAQVHDPQDSSRLYLLNYFSCPSSRPSLKSHHTDMMQYPPSHMLESGPSSTLPSFPSPEHWSFPPMRLY
ncbi:proline-rich protein 19 [Myripristis murdjan]|uniref:proline-rich protein 19 n=1 Tax=Myripristis murdjan TaxID=586833 RepID=UPI00117605C4|nr:uncharacterized protein LOC115374207 [Myripristis murdjan]XP_029928870.1 uncharacterized protein LOC115374207 [Myripristis murdjan]